ncbi:MAG: flagellar basal body rod protein FlgC [Anaerovibrio sp.]|nr:flagellar basal body rod protein FlgC [Veillonellaceae bacterium]MCI7265848.1 flagellar basal body rod protein FlgC [Veillonellaceae bacterium]MDY5329451.1 flagellar basal body rod protein FlgC [Anaerovibrio sp.]
MSMFGGIDAAASGLTAERLRMDVISNNIANVNSTRTVDGGPFKRKYVIFQPREAEKNSFSAMLDGAMNKGSKNRAGDGVRAIGIGTDDSMGKLVYDPGHPDANADGYVELPNVDIVTEMVDMITASRAYEANVTTINAAKSMAQQALNISK